MTNVDQQLGEVHAAVVSGLECRSDDIDLLVPETCVAQLIELEVSPLPLCQPWVRGTGIYQGNLVVVVGANPERRHSAARRDTKVVLLDVPDVGAVVAIEVEAVGRLTTAESNGEAGTGWLRAARTLDGRKRALLDVDQLRSKLVDPTRAGGPA